MRLSMLYEDGSWVSPANLYGKNQLKGKSNGWSFLKYPSDRKKFLNWSKGKKKKPNV